MRSYYNQSDLKKISEIVEKIPKSAKAYLEFEDTVYKEGNIPLKYKELIAISIAHVTGCPYCIDIHVKKFRELGGKKEEILEAVMIASTTRAGAILGHATQALLSFDDIDKKNKGEIKCFC